MTRNKKKIIRTATVPMSLKAFLDGSFETLMEKYELVLVSSPDRELFELQEKFGKERAESGEVREGLRVIGVPMERHISLTKDLKSLVQMIRVFHKEKPFMVHSMTPKAGLLCMMAAWVCRVPRRVHTFTGLVWPTAKGLSRRILMFTDWVTCACATHVIPEGKGVMDDLQRYITKKPMKVLGYGNVRGVDMVRWSRRPEVMKIAEGIKKDGVFTFVFVGRIVGDKGINELVEAFIKLLQKRTDVRLILVGPYENNLDPVSLLTQDRIDNTPEIEAVGSKSGDELAAYYAASDCFVFPSYREGFPNTVLEAGAMGLPSIVTDINGSREIITTTNLTNLTNSDKNTTSKTSTILSLDSSKLDIRDNGIVIPSKNVEALYQAMLRMVEDREMRETMAKNARPMIAERFEQRFVRKCLFDLYDEILK